ncbi:MAG: hypothetical protein HY842_06890 [Bacteroidetes bacterium]|nr:hypothetical protein [Bacteroidota bacterium]
MRFLILFSFFSGLPILSAQTNKGDWLLNGGLTVNYYEVVIPNHDNFIGGDFQPQIGYFFANGLAAGATFSLKTNFKRIPSKGVLPFFRGYFGKGKVRPFFQVDGGRVWTKIITTSHETTLNFRLGAGIFLSENVAIEGRLDYNVVNKTEAGPYSYGEKEGLTLGFGMNYFLTRNRVAKDSFSLLDEYLKKGNSAIGMTGFLDFEFYVATNIFWEKMLADRLRLKTNLNGFYWNGDSEPDDPDYLSYYILSIEAQPFVSLKKSTFFSPGGGINFNSVFAGKPFHSRHSFSIFAKPVLTQFFRRSLLELGVEFRHFFGNEYWEENFEDWSGNIFLGGEYFMSPRLSLRGELWANLFGNQVATQDLDFRNEAGSTHFRLGFHYFLKKK